MRRLKRYWEAVPAVGIFLIAGVSPAAGQTAATCPDGAALTRGLEPPLATVRYLADDALEGRLAGSPGERCAADYIVARFAEIGLVPGGAAGSWYQEVRLESTLNPHLPGGTGRNVIGVLRGADPVLREEFVVVGAHYDHLGRGGVSSLSPGVDAIHNGADDNASGVAALLAAARSLAAGPAPDRSVLFIAFTGEELGLLGSAQFVANGGIAPERIRAMLNLDMVGRLHDDPLIVYGVDTAEEWRGLLDAAAAREAVRLTVHGEGYGPSDHTSFYARDIPVLHFFTNVHGDYHQPGDDWEKIDVRGVTRVAAIVADLAIGLSRGPARLTLVRGAGTPPAQAGEGQTRGYGTYLGTVPDFTPVARGVLLSGVSPGSPAEEAGLRAGDVIVGLGEHTVADLQGLTDALRAHRPGDVVEVRFEREGREQRMNVKLGARAR